MPNSSVRFPKRKTAVAEPAGGGESHRIFVTAGRGFRKLTAHIASIGDLLREADYWARKSKANQIGKIISSRLSTRRFTAATALSRPCWNRLTKELFSSTSKANASGRSTVWSCTTSRAIPSASRRELPRRSGLARANLSTLNEKSK